MGATQEHRKLLAHDEACKTFPVTETLAGVRQDSSRYQCVRAEGPQSDGPGCSEFHERGWLDRTFHTSRVAQATGLSRAATGRTKRREALGSQRWQTFSRALPSERRVAARNRRVACATHSTVKCPG